MLPSYKESELPYFESSREFFYTTLLNVNYGMTDADFESLVEEEMNHGDKHTQKEQNTPTKYPQKEQNTPRKHPQKKLGKTAQAIIDAIVGNARITRSELAVLLDRSEDTIKDQLERLQARGIVERVGSDRGGYWKVHIIK